jgi:hypothetical protein
MSYLLLLGTRAIQRRARSHPQDTGNGDPVRLREGGAQQQAKPVIGFLGNAQILSLRVT